jgi:hypothetical protein
MSTHQTILLQASQLAMCVQCAIFYVRDLGFFTAVTMQVAVLWHVTQCILADRHQHFGGTCCVFLQAAGAPYIYHTTRSRIPYDNIISFHLLHLLH